MHFFTVILLLVSCRVMMIMCLLCGQHGADVNAIDHTGQTALHWSAVRGHIQVAELLLKEGAKVDAADLYGYQVCSLSIIPMALVNSPVPS